MAQEQLVQQQMQQQMMQYSNQAAQQVHDLERELLGMRGQYERDQLMLEQYDRVRYFLYNAQAYTHCKHYRESKHWRANSAVSPQISTRR